MNIDTLILIATWYGALCVAFNGLTVLISAAIKQIPGINAYAAVDKLYNNKIYKVLSWVFSWGDYVGEIIAKFKARK